MSIVFPMRRDRVFMFPAAMFRTRERPTHGGLDLTPVIKGALEPFYAPEAGVLTIVDRTAEKGDQSGLDVMVATKSGRKWWVGHASSIPKGLARGGTVAAGQHICNIGMSGNADGVHAHLELHYPAINQEVDPWPFLRDAPDITGSLRPLAASREKAVVEYARPDTTTPTNGDDVALTPAQEQTLDQLGKRIAQLDQMNSMLEQLWNRREILDAIPGELGGDPKAIAAAIVEAVGAELAHDVVEAITERLANG